MGKIHNLDESVVEYFEFIVNGHSYRFRHMNTEEMQQLKTMADDEEKTNEYLFSFITKIDKASPDFSDMQKRMIIPQWTRFRQMIDTEYSR